METLKDKAHDEYISNEYVADKIFDYEDVKEALLQYETFLDDLDNLGKSLSIAEFQNKHNQKRDLQFDYRKKFKEIFGDFTKQ